MFLYCSLGRGGIESGCHMVEKKTLKVGYISSMHICFHTHTHLVGAPGKIVNLHKIEFLDSCGTKQPTCVYGEAGGGGGVHVTNSSFLLT
jgi:hypothetical protein